MSFLGCPLQNASKVYKCISLTPATLSIQVSLMCLGAYIRLCTCAYTSVRVHLCVHTVLVFVCPYENGPNLAGVL